MGISLKSFGTFRTQNVTFWSAVFRALDTLQPVYLSNEILPHISCEGAKTCAGFAIWGPLVIISLSV